MIVKPIELGPVYNQEQQKAVEEAVASRKNTLNGFLYFAWSDRIVERGSQQFAIFGSMARELLPFAEVNDEKGRGEYIPLVVEGRMLIREPDEGQSGVAYLYRDTPIGGEPSQWQAIWPSLGWLWTSELEMGNQEISERIAEEIDQGACHITGGRHGL
ncbi:hypothetical protein [Marinimicrobium sp. ABcell2]|uniref:hypothetical protein n=1 Tax=Marinimicrobium sp. ABcell2 TaxID=3069751 RepID=UPI0027AEA4BB|nr:hypothetical protein [Marinimicrobium sp. ABcell2]MDQ2077464.1 hypothetical protein [Marinimicrobium sp. ABcell2]